MYKYEASKTILFSEVKHHGKRAVRKMLERQGYTHEEVLSLVPKNKCKRPK